MTRKQSLRIALVSVLAVAALSTIGGPSQLAMAQSGDPTGDPAATPSASPEAPTPEATSAATAEVEPAAGEVILWTTPDGTTVLKPGSNNLVTVRVSASQDEGTFNPATAQFQLVINGVFQPVQAASATPIGSNFTLDLTANVAGAPSGSSILFFVNRASNGTQVASPTYSVSRSTTSNLPFLIRDSGTSVIPRIITNTGISACNAVQVGTAGPLGAFVNYQVSNTRVDSWFYMVNPTPSATIIVSLTNYTVQGQLQVWFEQFGCLQLQPQPAVFGANPNPRLTIGNAPVGNIYFRVISASPNPPTPPPAPPPYNISWAYAGGSGPFEPNNNPCQAVPLGPGTTLTSFVDDQYDFYSMNITATSQIQVLVQGVTVGGAQVQVRSTVNPNVGCGDPVNSTSLIPPFGVVPSGGGDVLLGAVSIPGPGTYFIRVSLPNTITPPGTAYRVTWNYVGGGGTGGDTAGPIFTTNPNQPPTCNPAVPNTGCQGDIVSNIPETGSATFYWRGMSRIPGGYDGLQIRITAKTDLVGCSPTVFPSDPTRVNPQGYGNTWGNVAGTSTGSITFQFNKHGGYTVAFRAVRGGNQVFYDEKPMKVGCGTTAATFLDLEGKEAPFATQSLLDMADRPIAVFYEDTLNPARPHP
jgi:hypothetical protein